MKDLEREDCGIRLEFLQAARLHCSQLWQSSCVFLRKWWSVHHANQRGQWKKGIRGRNRSASDGESAPTCSCHTCRDITALMNIRLSRQEARRESELDLFNIHHRVGFSVFQGGSVFVITCSLSQVITPVARCNTRTRSAEIHVSFCAKLHFWLYASVQSSFKYMEIYWWGYISFKSAARIRRRCPTEVRHNIWYVMGMLTFLQKINLYANLISLLSFKYINLYTVKMHIYNSC